MVLRTSHQLLALPIYFITTTSYYSNIMYQLSDQSHKNYTKINFQRQWQPLSNEYFFSYELLMDYNIIIMLLLL